MSSSRLARAAAVAVALATVSLLAPAARAQPRSLTARAVGDVDQDLVFVPVRPCRVIDTRLAGGPLAPGEERQFVISGTVGFEAQGGTPGGCGVPRSAIVRGATAVALNLVAVNPQGPGNLRAWAFSPVFQYA